MTGSMLSDLATKHIGRPMQEPLFDLIFFIRDNQYMVSDWKRYKVVKGAGMGLTLSGEVSDLALLALMETPCALSNERKSKYGE